MGFLSNLFGFGNRIQCPRCLGKGYVDMEDIKRLKKELHWKPGNCAYCKGRGKVKPEMLNKIAVDTTYLTVNISREERRKLINKDEETVERAQLVDVRINEIIREILYLHTVCHLDPVHIAGFYLIHIANELHENGTYDSEKEDMLRYVHQVIALNSKSELN